MTTNFLLPNQFKKIGWFLFIPGMILGIIYLAIEPEVGFFNLEVFAIASQPMFKNIFFSMTENNVLDEITGLLLIIGGLLITSSKAKSEDEFISKIRLESLLWATYVNYFILILTIIFIYDLIFFWILVFNMFTVLIFFTFRFNWVLYKSKKQIRDEE